MKLKEARRKAGELGYRWVAVDENKKVFAYKEPPTSRGINWGECSADARMIEIGQYTGSKNWRYTRAKAIKPVGGETYFQQAVEYSTALYAILADAELRDDYEVQEIEKIVKAALAAKHVGSVPSDAPGNTLASELTSEAVKKQWLADGFRLGLLSVVQPDVRIERRDDDVTWTSGAEDYKREAIILRGALLDVLDDVSAAPNLADNPHLCRIHAVLNTALMTTARPGSEDA